MTKRQSLIILARFFLFVREVGGPNLGLWVGIFQRFVGIPPGSSWCAAFVCFVLAVVVGGKGNLPIPCTGVCEEIHAHAKANGMIVPAEQAISGDLYLYVDDTGHAHHAGFVTTPKAADGVAGNTSSDGKSSNGDGVYEHALLVAPNHIVIVRLPLE